MTLYVVCGGLLILAIFVAVVARRRLAEKALKHAGWLASRAEQAAVARAELKLAVATHELSAEHLEKIERLNDEQANEAGTLRSDPDALSSFLVNAGKG